VLIRHESTTDVGAIRSLNYSAFKDHPHHEPGAEPTEHLIVDRLREESALTLSLVAEEGDQVVGYIAISPVTIGGKDNAWFGLGPVAVLPSSQNQGVGSLLIRTAIKEMEKRNASGIVVMGDPKYYTRFGFSHFDVIRFPGIPSEYFMKRFRIRLQAIY
jgi:putative acetyltransferase